MSGRLDCPTDALVQERPFAELRVREGVRLVVGVGGASYGAGSVPGDPLPAAVLIGDGVAAEGSFGDHGSSHLSGGVPMSLPWPRFAALACMIIALIVAAADTRVLGAGWFVWTSAGLVAFLLEPLFALVVRQPPPS